MRVCQFRHDGKWTSFAAARSLPYQEDLHFHSTSTKLRVKRPTKRKADHANSALADQYSCDVRTGMTSISTRSSQRWTHTINDSKLGASMIW